MFPFYKNTIGNPSELDEYEGEVEYFEYNGKYQPSHQYKGDRWGIDMVLHHETDYDTKIEMQTNGISLAEFLTLSQEMENKFGIDKSQVRLISYTWYNGGDEPVFFGEEGEDNNE